MDYRQGKRLGNIYGWSYTHTGRRRTKKPFFFVFPSSTEPTGVIDTRDIAINS